MTCPYRIISGTYYPTAVTAAPLRTAIDRVRHFYGLDLAIDRLIATVMAYTASGSNFHSLLFGMVVNFVDFVLHAA